LIEDAADEAALRELASEFFGSYASKDLERFMRLWAPESPDLVKRRELARLFFASNDEVQVTGLAFRKLEIKGAEASLWVSLVITAIDSKSRKPAAGLGKVTRSLHCVRKRGAWKVRHEGPAEVDFATELLAAPTDSSRSSLIEANADLITPALTQALFELGIHSV
jgi:hypothetical protein